MLMCFRMEKNPHTLSLINGKLFYSQFFTNLLSYLRNCFSFFFWPQFAQLHNEGIELYYRRSLRVLVFCEYLTHSSHICWINECVTLVYHQLPKVFMFQTAYESVFSLFFYYHSWSQTWTVVGLWTSVPPSSWSSEHFCSHTM